MESDFCLMLSTFAPEKKETRLRTTIGTHL